MQFYFYKLSVYKYQIHSNENTKTYFKCIPQKTQQHTLIKYIPKKNTTTYLYAYIINSVICCIFFCFIKICNSPWHGIVRLFLDVWCYTIPCITYSILHHFSFTWNLVNNHFLYYVLKVLYGVHVWRIPRPFQN